MKTKRIISTLLALLMLVSAFTITAAAEETQAADGHVAMPEEGWKTTSARPTLHYFRGDSIVAVKKDESGQVTQWGGDGEKVIFTAEDKLEYMDLRFIKDGYELYVDQYSGEVATRCIATGEVLFTNPYTVGDSVGTGSMASLKNKTNEGGIKSQLMSQLVVKYIDIASGETNTYHSFTWAASRGQIVVRNIKNGIRVEYTIGREEARLLVPVHIEKNSFETKILNVMEAAIGDSEEESEARWLFKQMTKFYELIQLEKSVSEKAKTEILNQYPIAAKMDLYVLDSAATQVEKSRMENLIKTYCPDYTYEELDADHLLTEYQAEDKNPPLFKMALEYSLDANGLTVRLPANGIRFNESLYQLYSVEILPYMGTGAFYNKDGNFAVDNSGYTFFPDGSGTLFDFEKISELGASTTITGKVYGQDYAYHTISGTHQEIIRYPVFGIIETENLTNRQNVTVTVEDEETEEGEEGEAPEGETPEEELPEGDTPEGDAPEGETPEGEGTVSPLPVPDEEEVVEKEAVYKDRGFVAIVEEGDALMELSSYHAVVPSEYNTIRMIVYPRPQDTYNVADAISVGQNDTWTVVSSRKYTGNYKVRYIMLTDSDTAAEKNIAEGDYYEASYVGMAKAYREYLEGKGVLTRLTENDVKNDIPLYIETFGSVFSTEKFLSIPFDVVVPLTTFDDIVTMYDELSAKGVSNINFIMTGYTDGGLEYESMPYNLKWEKAVKGEYNFEELVGIANEKGFGVYPDFNFVFSSNDGAFDGLSLRKHAVKTIDDRYTSKREYSSTKQTYLSYFELAISPAYFSHFYEKFTQKYLKYNPMGISVSTLGSYLNSDFDEDEPYNREDSKEFTVEAFKYLDENYSKVLTKGGNAYTWQYVDYITDVALDSSRYAQSAAAVPFLGMVLHGYVEFAGSAINMEGNIDYALLKAIESGASLKFILSYQNTNKLKEWTTLSKYYSIRYDIWYDDVIELYGELNDVLADLQTSVIVEHEFIDGTRVPDDDEILADAKNAVEAAVENEKALKQAAIDAEIDFYREARTKIASSVDSLLEAKASETSNLANNLKAYSIYLESLQKEVDSLKTMAEEVALLKADAEANPTDETKKAAYEKAVADMETFANSNYAKAVKDLHSVTKIYLNQIVKLCKLYTTVTVDYRDALMRDEFLSEADRVELLANLDRIDVNVICENNDYVAFINAVVAEINAIQKEGNAYITDPLLVPADYEYEIKEDEVVDTDNKIHTPIYGSDTNKIVYEEYENGTAFILNFNNYGVRVELDGVIYTVDAYGYVILKQKS